jgi:hypothetical protein
LTRHQNPRHNCQRPFAYLTAAPIAHETEPINYNPLPRGNLWQTKGSNQLYLIGCRANWRWSNCKPLIVGEFFPADISGGTMTLTGTKNGKKEIHTKYNILQVSPK